MFQKFEPDIEDFGKIFLWQVTQNYRKSCSLAGVTWQKSVLPSQFCFNFRRVFQETLPDNSDNFIKKAVTRYWLQLIHTPWNSEKILQIIWQIWTHTKYSSDIQKWTQEKFLPEKQSHFFQLWCKGPSSPPVYKLSLFCLWWAPPVKCYCTNCK